MLCLLVDGKVGGCVFMCIVLCRLMCDRNVNRM